MRILANAGCKQPDAKIDGSCAKSIDGLTAGNGKMPPGLLGIIGGGILSRVAVMLGWVESLWKYKDVTFRLRL